MITKRNFLILLTLITLFKIYLSTKIFNNDFFNHLNWINSINDHGFSGFYERDFSPWAAANYPPLAVYFFYITGKIFSLLPKFLQTTNIHAGIYKLPSILADSYIAYFLYKNSNKSNKFLFPLIFLLNPALFINSTLWGQIESLLTVFIFLSLINYKKNQTLSYIFFTLSLMVKQNALFFLPIFAYLTIKHHSYLSIVKNTIISYLIALILFLPFASPYRKVEPISFYLNTLGGQIHQQQASVHAFNFWYALGQNNISDGNMLGPFSYRIVSLILLSIFSLFTIYVLNRNKSKNPIIASGIIALCTFVFLTRMHERHLYPALVFLIPLLTKPRTIIYYIILSLIHTINLTLVWLDYILAPPNPSFININQLANWLSIITIVITFLFIYEYKNLSRRGNIFSNFLHKKTIKP